MHFVIAGKINCLQFSFALMVAQRLQENLPNFTYLKIPKKPDEYEKWLVRTCQENGWYHIESPIIWREIALKQGKKQFIGNINKFLDLCYDYYGVSRELLSAESFNRGEMEWFAHKTERDFYNSVKRDAKKKIEHRSRQVCITGASTQIAEIIIMELLQMSSQKREDGLEIRLFDEASKLKKLESSASDAKYCPGPSGLGNCRVASTLKQALSHVDLVIVLDSIPRRQKETVIKWLKRNRNAMCALGRALNLYAPPHCRVIIGNPSSQPTCYNATVLAAFASKLHVRNIVAVTQDLGREMLQVISSKINVPVRDLYCPPVWGFVGLNKHIDVSRTLQTHLYKVPGKRLQSTLPQGFEEYELRTTDCLLREVDAVELYSSVAKHKTEIIPQLGRQPCLAKATAILDLLRIWGIKREDGNGEIISLGVYSDGTFNIPEGLYWSQPVILKNGFWVPFKKFPVPRSFYFNCHSLFIYSIASLFRTKVRPRKEEKPKPRTRQKEVKKFDFNKLLEEVGMPVIRTDTECLNYLKYLAKHELGIDFDVVNDTITEEDLQETPPPMETVRYQTYCECWRQELKQMQKVVFDRSSTTEIEVDLTDNLSSSECSIINPRLPVAVTESDSVSGKSEPEAPTGEEVPKSPSLVTVCSCGVLPSGSLCKCRPPKPVTPTNSTEHFYKDQNAEIFDQDLTDVIYEDNFIKEKKVVFDEDAKKEDVEDRSRLKFYGIKDAIRDEKAQKRLKDKIYRYEHPGEGIIGESTESKSSSSNTDIERAKESHVQISSIEDDLSDLTDDGTQYSGVKGRGTLKSSRTSFREMYSDKIIPPFKLYTTDTDQSGGSESEKNLSVYGEEIDFDIKYRSFEGEESGGRIYPPDFSEPPSSFKSWEAVAAYEEFEEDMVMQPRTSIASDKKKKRQGIPLCCLCRCIVPEGLPCCPCGTTTVVEVFKKESVEVLVEEESEMTFRIEYVETELPSEESTTTTTTTKSSSRDLLDELDFERKLEIDFDEDESRDKQEKRKRSCFLPPESFFPFSPKYPNVFQPPPRPVELTKDYIKTKNKDYTVPDKCLELIELAKNKIEASEKKLKSKESSKESDKESMKFEESEDLPDLSSCGEEEEKIKTDFSNLHFITEGIENWTITIQKKYQDWFYSEADIRDETYYDPAIEEVSDDEYEVDEELEKYFES